MKTSKTLSPSPLLEVSRWFAAVALATVGLLLVAPAARAQYDAAPAAYGQDGYGAGDSYGYDDTATYESGYSYVRNVRGDATLILPDGDREQIQVNQPILTGDRLWVAPGSMAEVLLSDGNLLRLDGGSEVAFDSVAGSPESRDDATVLRLLVGNAQLVVYGDSLGRELPRIDLPNATVYVGEAGRYRVTTDRSDWGQVVARGGWAEVVTDRGSEVVRSGRELLVEGYPTPRLAVRQAGGYDSLERWGERLDHQVADSGYYRDYDDRSLRYAAAPLDDHGSWFRVEGRHAWRPHVTGDWRPYTQGRWRYTSIGLTWVSHEPWGWVPYHYGTWDYVPGHGWSWFPGRYFSPARVYWYWGPEHVAWVPWGYYTRHYDRYSGFRFGVYGWAGGDWGIFSDWVVCPTRYFGHRYQNRYVHDGRYWGRHYGNGVLPRGLVTTDTRGLTPDRWHQPEEAMRVLRTRPGRGGGAGATRGADLPDVTPFVARQPDLSADVVRRVVAVDGTRGDRGDSARRGVDPSDVSGPGGPPVRVVGTRGEDAGGTVRGGGDGVRGDEGRAGVVRRPRPVTGGDGGRDSGVGIGGVRGSGEGAPRGDDDRRVRVVRPRGESPSSGGGTVRGSGDRGASPGARPDAGPRGDRPRTARPADPGRGGTQGSDGQGSGARGSDGQGSGAGARVVRPRGQASPDGGGGGGSADRSGGEGRTARPPARIAPRGGTDRGGATAGSRDDRTGERERPSAVRPRGTTRSGGGDLSSSPRFRGSASPASPSAPAPGASERRDVRRPARVQPPRGDSGSSAVPTPPPRRERAGSSSEPPARRVLQGVRSPRSGSTERPSARSPRTDSTEPPAARSPRSGSTDRQQPRPRLRTPQRPTRDEGAARGSSSRSGSRPTPPPATSPQSGSRSSSPRATSPRSGSRSSTPRATSPRSGSRSSSPRTTSPRSGSRSAPQATSPQSGSRSSSPRASSPQSGSRSSASSQRSTRSGGSRSSASSRSSSGSSAGSRGGGSRSSERPSRRTARDRDDG